MSELTIQGKHLQHLVPCGSCLWDLPVWVPSSRLRVLCVQNPKIPKKESKAIDWHYLQGVNISGVPSCLGLCQGTHLRLGVFFTIGKPGQKRWVSDSFHLSESSVVQLQNMSQIQSFCPSHHHILIQTLARSYLNFLQSLLTSPSPPLPYRLPSIWSF